MNKLNKAIKILETYGFEFVDDEKQANIIIKTKPEIKDNKAFYKVIKAVNSCRTQVELVTLTLLDLFDEKEDRKFIAKYGLYKKGNLFYKGKLGENDFLVKSC